MGLAPEGGTVKHRATRSDHKMDVITFIALATTLIVLIGHLMNVGLW
jgi:hypothetical protein